MNLHEIKLLVETNATNNDILTYINTNKKSKYNYSDSKKHEINSLIELCKSIKEDVYKDVELNINIIEGIFEFDFVKSSTDKIVVLDLKSELPKKGIVKIKNQMTRFNSILEDNYDKVSVYTFIVGHGLVKLVDGCCQASNFESLEKDLEEIIVCADLNITFKSSDVYSELNQKTPMLSNQQSDYINNMTQKKGIYIVEGEAGSGKSLMIKTIAKKHDVLIMLPFKKAVWDQENFLREYNKIDSYGYLNYLEKKINDDNDRKILLIDEGQRITEKQAKLINEINMHTIIFKDSCQELGSKDIKLEEYLKKPIIQKLNSSFRISKKKLNLIKILCSKEENCGYTEDDFYESFKVNLLYSKFENKIDLLVSTRYTDLNSSGSCFNHISREYDSANLLIKIHSPSYVNKEFLDKLYISMTRSGNLKIFVENTSNFKNFIDLVSRKFKSIGSK